MYVPGLTKDSLQLHTLTYLCCIIFTIMPRISKDSIRRCYSREGEHVIDLIERKLSLRIMKINTRAGHTKNSLQNESNLS